MNEIRFERMLHNISINWITCALSQTSTLYYSVYFAALCVNSYPVNITSNIVPVMATIRYKSTSDPFAGRRVYSSKVLVYYIIIFPRIYVQW